MGMLLWFSPLISVAQSDDSNQNERIIANSKMIGWGRTNLLDTYLSPEEYVGLDLRYISHTLRKRRNSRVIHELIHQGNIAYVDNRARNGREIAGNYNFQFGLHYLLKHGTYRATSYISRREGMQKSTSDSFIIRAIAIILHRHDYLSTLFLQPH